MSYAFQRYQLEIPNGDAVPNPCSTNAGDIWNGVGHEAVGGAGARNPFGLAFAGADRVSCHIGYNIGITGQFILLS